MVARMRHLVANRTMDMDWNTIIATSAVVSVGIVYTLSSMMRKNIKTYQPTPSEELSQYPVGKHSVVDRYSEKTPILSESGYASTPPTTVIKLFEQAVERHGDEEALRVERQVDGEWQWSSWTWNQYQTDVLRAARSFIRLGLNDKDAVSTIGFNSPEWLISHMGCIFAGGLSAGIYTTNDSQACAYIVNHSKSAVVVAENQMQLDKFLEVISELTTVKAIVVYSGKISRGSQKKAGAVQLFTWQEFLDYGSEAEQEELNLRMENAKPGKPCTLIYTSGTTGNPKAVMLSHDNVTWTTGSILNALDIWGTTPERIVSYLPLSHIAAQLEDIFFPICTSAQASCCTVWFARPDALKGTLKDTLVQAKPTFFFGVPRVWEKFMEGMKAKGLQSSGLKKFIASCAKSVGTSHFVASQVGGSGKIPLLYPLFKAVVFNPVRKALGLDQCKAMMTGAAPIATEVLEYFGSLDLFVHNLYGMSECTGPMTSCLPDFFRVGTAGSPLAGMELKIVHEQVRDKPGEGEICYRGRHIMMGYMDDQAKTDEAIDSEGFLHSGDVGKFSGGLLSITGRIKELIITAGGENIAPVPIEECLKAELPAISNIMMVGDQRKYNTCLITLKTTVDEEGVPTETLSGEACEVSKHSKTVEQAKQDPIWKEYIEAGIKRYNQKSVSRAQNIQKFVILDRDFSTSGGELTATLKLKRSVVSQMYSAEIESMY